MRLNGGSARPRTPHREVQARLQELEDTLRAIRRGEVDAVVVATPDGDRVFTLQGADHPYRVMVEAINEGAATLTSHGQVLYANRRFAEMLGIGLENLIGSRLLDFVQSLECPTLDELLERALSAPQKEECLLRLPDGKFLPAYLSLSPMKDLDLQAICVIATDLSEHKARQAELARTNDLLKAEIAERKRAEDALRQLTGRLLSLQDEERRRIARDLHDSTAQTLNGLVLNLAYLQSQVRKEGDPNNGPKMLAESISLAEQAATEIRNLSHLLYPPALDQMGLMTAIQWHASRTSEVTGIAITLDIPSEIPRLPREIEVALFRVFQESLENVRRHSGSQVADVRLTLNGDGVLLEVKDQGRGMPSEPAHAESTGVGLGVAGMRERLRQLDGRLEIESGDQGTTVKARVSLANGKTSAKQGRASSALRVLIVDDSAAVRGGVRALLAGDPHLEFVGDAANGREAVTRAIELQPDIVLLDLAMPEMDGLEAARKIGAVTPQIRILAFSQDDSAQMAEAARKAGALGYVLKSDAAQDLVPAVKAVSEGRTFFSATIAKRLRPIN